MTAYAFLDLETTGIEPNDESFILELACVIVDHELKPIKDSTWSSLVHPRGYSSNDLYMASDTVVRAMHEQSGLWADLERLERDEHAWHVAETTLVEDVFGDWLAQHAKNDQLVLAGSGVARFDRPWLQAKMPWVLTSLAYYEVDLSSMRRFVQGIVAAPELWPVSDPPHRALPDVLQQLEEARRFRSALISLLPGR